MNPAPPGWIPEQPGGAIPPEGIAVWRIALELCPAEVAIGRSFLSIGEIARADRFFRDRDRAAYTIQRAALRVHAAAYLGRDPRSLEFDTTQRGKPALVGADAWLQFNASGSGNFGLLAFARDTPLGIDLERHRPVDFEELARQFFSRDEIAELSALGPTELPQGFFNAWVRKEAFIKALGEGLYFGLDRFSVSLSPGLPARLLHVDGSEELAREWTLSALDVAPEYSAAIVWRGGPFRLRFRDSPPPSQWSPPIWGGA